MVSVKEDTVDFDKLEQEVYKAVEADERYNRENDAKFRAVNQKVATYDEFRDIVLASHIKPLEKEDRLDQIERFTQPWNIHGKKSDSKEADTGQIQSKPSIKMPSNGHELARDWRRECKSDKDKFEYLLAIGGENLTKIFKSEISFGLLGDILGALNKEFDETRASEVFSIVKSLSTVNRFQLSVQFLSGPEKEECAKLFEKLSIALKDSEKEQSSELMRDYGIK